jgi:hypothetical protein
VIESYLRTEDRRVLEQIIYPYLLSAKQYQQILFVGCQWYTRAYNKRFEGKKDYWTIDIDQQRTRHGAKQHIVDGMQNMRKYFQADTLDLILYSGVFVWGLDAKGMSSGRPRHVSTVSARVASWSSATMTSTNGAHSASRTAALWNSSSHFRLRLWSPQVM